MPIFKGLCLFIPVQLDIFYQTFCDAVKAFILHAKNASKPITIGTSWISQKEQSEAQNPLGTCWALNTRLSSL